ncbi:hypothetical protein IGI04_015316 [Brassica rapa subsp. trilocularis]|uniref:Uncharacterized protein n=1 Tax=Brassica rapa subsp. trilocularis TaxID=1813537 RepID=A0ABQ7MT49_BRACM|nr:hypothetical protein IGI04_015316 [Brassica rapa subsp. trilocularis]
MAAKPDLEFKLEFSKRGSFAQVLECSDNNNKEAVAIKLVDVLQRLTRHDLVVLGKNIAFWDKLFHSLQLRANTNLVRLSCLRSLNQAYMIFEVQRLNIKTITIYIVSTRHYRAPEGLDETIRVICGVLVAYLLKFGEALFQTPENRRSERYFRRGAKLDWPEGAASRDSLKAVWKLPRLLLIMQHVDHSAGDDPTKCSL